MPVSIVHKDNSRISGVEVTIDGEIQSIEAKKGVVIASGGFEFNEEFTKRYLRGPINGPIGVPTNTGDGLKMALDAGADVAHLNEAWWCPTMKIYDEEFEDTQVYRLARGERHYQVVYWLTVLENVL